MNGQNEIIAYTSEVFYAILGESAIIHLTYHNLKNNKSNHEWVLDRSIVQNDWYSANNLIQKVAAQLRNSTFIKDQRKFYNISFKFKKLFYDIGSKYKKSYISGLTIIINVKEFSQ